MDYKIEKNYHRFQINKTMYKYLLDKAESKGYKKEDYDTFKEVFTRGYAPEFGTIRIATKGVITYIFCARHTLVNFEEFETPWTVCLKGGKWCIFEYYRTEPNDTADTNTSHTTGQSAWRTVTSQIRKKYTEEEIIDNLKKHQVTQQPQVYKKSIFKKDQMINANIVYECDNCHYYDLNKAYAAATIKVFPKLEPWVKKQYKHNKPKMKQTMNYFVGMMVNKGEYLEENIFPYFRNYIIQSVNDAMDEAWETVLYGDESMNFSNTKIVYANTDGFIVTNPVQSLETSSELGDFKEEQIDNGKVWFYKHEDGFGIIETDASYTIFQYFQDGKKVIKCIGGFRTDEALLEKTDLSKGIVPLFTFEEIAGIKEIDPNSIDWIEEEVISYGE